MDKNLFVSIGNDLIETKISAEDLKTGDLILVRVGNDTFPVYDKSQIEAVEAIVTPLLRAAGVTAPILVWNHIISIESLKFLPPKEG